MNTNELMKLASETKPEVIEKVASNVKLIEAMAPDFVPEVLQEFKEITEITHEKVAALSDLGVRLVGAGAAALGTAIATDLFDAAKRGLTKSTNFRRIMESNPDLKRDVDAARLKASFDVIHKYAPEFTSDPIMGGSILRAVAELPGQEMAVIKDLIKSRGDLLNAKTRQFNMGEAGKLMNGSWDTKDEGKDVKSRYGDYNKDTKTVNLNDEIFNKYSPGNKRK